MYTGQWDLFTLILYVFIGIVCGILVKRSLLYNKSNGIDRLRINKYDILFILLLTIFATFRKVDVHLGGQDALNYISFFENSISNKTYNENIFKFLLSEKLFLLINQAIRIFTDDYHVLFAFCYGFIALSYILLIKSYYSYNTNFIPFILVIFPYLRGFCTLRTSLAIAFIYIGFVIFKNNKYIGLIVILSSFLIHRSAFLFIAIFSLYFIYNAYAYKLKGFKLIIFIFSNIAFSIIIGKTTQNYLLSSDFLSVTDRYYLKISFNYNLISRWPMYFTQLILLLAIAVIGKNIDNSENMKFIKTLCILDFITVPASLILGIWRFNEFIYIPRLIMWGEMFRIIREFFKKRSRILVSFILTSIIISWLIFRILSEWDDLKIMPYIFDMF